MAFDGRVTTSQKEIQTKFFLFHSGGHFRKSQNGNDNVESIDMEMSDEDFEDFPDFADPFEDGEFNFYASS